MMSTIEEALVKTFGRKKVDELEELAKNWVAEGKSNDELYQLIEEWMVAEFEHKRLADFLDKTEGFFK